jgi:hypothetical protein
VRLSLERIKMFTLRTPKKAWNLQTWKGSIRKFHTDLGSMPEIKTKKTYFYKWPFRKV